MYLDFAVLKVEANITAGHGRKIPQSQWSDVCMLIMAGESKCSS